MEREQNMEDSDFSDQESEESVRELVMEQKGYRTHINGSQPFTVVIEPNEVKVYEMYVVNADGSENNVDDDEDKPWKEVYDPEDPVYRTQYKYVFVGEDYNEGADGNSILVKVRDKEYIFIGEHIQSFKTREDVK